MSRLSPCDVNELRGRTQLLPQLSCAGIGTARFGRGEAFDGLQRRGPGTAKFDFLSLTPGPSGNSGSWSSPICNCAAASAIAERAADLGLAVHQLGGMAGERFSELGVQLL